MQRQRIDLEIDFFLSDLFSDYLGITLANKLNLFILAKCSIQHRNRLDIFTLVGLCLCSKLQLLIQIYCQDTCQL